ncbi:hypothetical protein TcasGA2_TC007309 [Tribolium castaneum]|uniref:Uncharacterized protein n=1 Tax=Tribolium castaneum TaxID=7070 RepID=D2A0A5_TRICA|nr:hypothetical protein TcasGA2_TC007309 [Tribolium castaneum]
MSSSESMSELPLLLLLGWTMRQSPVDDATAAVATIEPLFEIRFTFSCLHCFILTLRRRLLLRANYLIGFTLNMRLDCDNELGKCVRNALLRPNQLEELADNRQIKKIDARMVLRIIVSKRLKAKIRQEKFTGKLFIWGFFRVLLFPGFKSLNPYTNRVLTMLAISKVAEHFVKGFTLNPKKYLKDNSRKMLGIRSRITPTIFQPKPCIRKINFESSSFVETVKVGGKIGQKLTGCLFNSNTSKRSIRAFNSAIKYDDILRTSGKFPRAKRPINNVEYSGASDGPLLEISAWHVVEKQKRL